MQRTFSGEFAIAEPAPGTWQIDNRQAPHQQILLRGVQTSRAAVPATPTSVRVIWSPGEPVAVTLADGARSVTLACATALSHEPEVSLYGALALAAFTVDRQRFWRRVFRVVRIPGGRLLLGLIARRARRSR